MVSGDADPLARDADPLARDADPLTRDHRQTSVGFRRDLKLFLFVLAAFFALLVVALVLLLQANVEQTEEFIRGRLNTAADTAARDVRASLQTDADLEAQLISIASRTGFAGIELTLPGRSYRTGFTGEGLEALERPVGAGKAKLYFDPSPFRALRRRFQLTALITMTAMAAGLVMLFLYIPRITRPIEAMLGDAAALGDRDHNVDEAAYLIETFRNSIATLRKQEDELKTLHEREKTRADDLQTVSATLMRSLNSGLIAFDAEDRIVEMNNAARTILSVDASANFSGRQIADAVGENAFSEVVAGALSRREILSRHELEWPKDGAAPAHVGLTSIPLLSESGRFLGTLVLFTDLSQVRRLETRVREMQTLADLGEMSAGIAHEFRNSLSTILGFLKLAGRMQPEAPVEAKLKAAEAEANALAGAVDSLLQFARPMRPELEPVDLRALVEQLAAQTRERTPGIEIAVRGEPAVIRGDSGLLARAVDNILRNAAEAVSENGGAGRVTVEVTGNPHPVIRISDNGAGVDQDEAAKVFLPFYSTKSTGVGIGLPLARKIVLLHGGTLRFDSRPGAGTSVTADFDADVLPFLPTS